VISIVTRCDICRTPSGPGLVEGDYGYRVTPVRSLQPSDADQLVQRVVDQLIGDAFVNPLVNPMVDQRLLRDSFRATNERAWVADEHKQLTGHLYGAVLGDRAGERAVWTGPDGVSFDDDQVLRELHRTALPYWRSTGAREHFVWCLSEPTRLEPWHALGYTLAAVRGSLELRARATREFPDGYTLRRGTIDDFERCLKLDEILDTAQGVDLRTLSREQRIADREELFETLSDDECHLYVVEHRGRIVAQCVTFPSPQRRGSFDHTIYLSEVVVEPHHEHRGVASALIDAALSIALAHGFGYVETQWRLSNLRATLYWTNYGFSPTYVRLRRALEIS
jgi:ribosomal protein S18 acetylase RimI-like enzyme